MYLHRLEIENFRIFGSRQEDGHGVIDLQPGLNLLIGENDSGKTCVIDAIRLLVGTVTQDYFTVQESDFHVSVAQEKPAPELTILREFRGLNSMEAGALLEYLSVEEDGAESEFYLRMWLKAERNDGKEISDKQIGEITGIYGDFIEGEFCKIFDNEDFGFNRITVERPLRLNYQTSEERIALLENEKAFQNRKKRGKQVWSKRKKERNFNKIYLQCLKVWMAL